MRGTEAMITWTEEDIVYLRALHIKPPRIKPPEYRIADPGVYLVIGACAAVILVMGLFGMLRAV